jgi:choline dehydrogenase-like flavoprotein
VIEDARRIADGTTLSADLAIIGAGAAGITIAREFANQKTSVLLLESGGLDFDERTQALYAGSVSDGLYDLEVSRLRYFGGSTNHWGGVCRPLDDDDFAVRGWLPNTGWPITATDLKSYYDRACDLTQLPGKRWNLEHWNNRLAEFYRLPMMGKRIAGAVFLLSPPTRFGEAYRESLQSPVNIRALLHVNAVEILADESATQVIGVRCACLSGPRILVQAKVYVLAAGPVETARLLLASTASQPSGLGNGHDTVGRYYSNHPGFYAGDIILSQPKDVLARPLSAMQTILPRLIVTADAAAAAEIGKFSTWANPVDEDGSMHLSDGYVALRSLFRDFRHGNVSTELLAKLGRVLADVDGAAADVWSRFRPAPFIRLDPEWEQVPNPDSRVTLIADRDELGMQRVHVEWKLTDDDIRTLRTSLEIIGEVIGEAGFGRIRVHEWLQSDPRPQTFPGHENYHPSSTTRMSDDPRRGVVDRNCRVHGIGNLYVSGASVFPTIGAVNPTLTVVALALRLADHLKSLVV